MASDGCSTKSVSPGVNSASSLAVLLWFRSYRLCIYRTLILAAHSYSAAQRMMGIRRAIADSTGSTTSSIRFAVVVADPSECLLSPRLQGGMFGVRCTFVLKLYVKATK